MPQPSYDEVHGPRFRKSIEWLTPFIAGARVLELGGAGTFTKMVRDMGAEVVPSIGDLRYQVFKDSDMASFDLVLCMEVLEHIADQEPRQVISDEWKGTGTRYLLKSCYEALKPGGFLFLTTPNAASITAIHHALNLKPGFIYRPHVREYAPYELDEMVRQAGFEILRRETFDLWLNAIGPSQYANIQRFIERSNYPRELRGEDIFLLAQK